MAAGDPGAPSSLATSTEKQRRTTRPHPNRRSVQTRIKPPPNHQLNEISDALDNQEKKRPAIHISRDCSLEVNETVQKLGLSGFLCGLALLCRAEAADLPAQTRQPASAPFCFASVLDYLLASAQECPLTQNGITVYGTIDMGAGYQHGAPFNDVYPWRGRADLEEQQWFPLRSDSKWARPILHRRQRQRGDRWQLVTRVQSAKRF